MDKTVKYADEKFLSELCRKREKMKKAVCNTASEYVCGENGKIYYFSENGSDLNSGLSEASPKKTPDGLKSLDLKAGDVVLFKRGEIFRGHIVAQDGVTYSAYGNGEKPVICGSRMNYAEPELWKETERKNVWLCTESVNNAGIVLLDYDGKLGNYEEKTAIGRYIGVNGFSGVDGLSEDTEFWNELETGRFYMLSKNGNPGERFSSIEIGEGENVFTCGSYEKKLESRNVTVDNLHITLTGTHGVGALDSVGLTVKNCIFDWIGGSVLFKTCRFGNAVEMYGNCHGYHVYNNWIYQIYDTGITHQQSEDVNKKSNVMTDVCYHDNLVEYCYWSIEYYNAVVPDAYRQTSDVRVYGNYCRMGGYGWGCKGRESSSPMYALSRTPKKTERYVTENNIFENCLGELIASGRPEFNEDKCYTFRRNTYVQPYGAVMARISKKLVPFDENVFDFIENTLYEENAKVYFLK